MLSTAPKRQQGFTLVEVAIASVLMVAVATMGLYAYSQQMATDVARAQGANLSTLNDAVNAYEGAYATQLVAGTAIPYPDGTGSVANILAPTATDLAKLSLLNSNFAAFTPSGGTYQTRITVLPAGCTFNCAVNGTVWLTSPMLNQKGAVDYIGLSDALGAAGGNAAVSSASSPGTVSGANAQWTMPNPQGAVSGILAMRNGQGVGGLSGYLRRDGSNAMYGNLNMGGQDVVNATNITAAGAVNAATVNASTVNAPTVNATTLNATNATLTGTVSAGTLTVNWENAGTINSTTLNSSTVNAPTVNATNVNATNATLSGTVSATNASIANTVSAGTVNMTNGSVGGTLSANVISVNWTNAGTVSAGTVSTPSLSATTINSTNINNSNWLGTSSLNVSGSAYAGSLILAQGQTLNFNGTNNGLYGDGSNLALRAAGTTFIQTPWGTDGNLQAGNITTSYLQDNGSAQINGSAQVNGNFTVGGSTTTIGNAQLYGSLNANGNLTGGYIGSNGRVVANEYFQVNGVAGVNGGCSPNGLQGRDGSGAPLFCVNGVWRSAGISSTTTRTSSFGTWNNGRDASGTTNCAANETLLSGGVDCNSSDGLAFIMFSRPSGNSWFGQCGDPNGNLTPIVVYAVCAL